AASAPTRSGSLVPPAWSLTPPTVLLALHALPERSAEPAELGFRHAAPEGVDGGRQDDGGPTGVRDQGHVEHRVDTTTDEAEHALGQLGLDARGAAQRHGHGDAETLPHGGVLVDRG